MKNEYVYKLQYKSGPHWFDSQTYPGRYTKQQKDAAATIATTFAWVKYRAVLDKVLT